jgi:uncharacterized protein YkwD
MSSSQLSLWLVTVSLCLLPLPGCAEFAAQQPAAPAGRGGDADPNAAARLVVEQTNAFRRQHRLDPLRVDPKLTDTGLDFARYLARTNRFGHTADGTEPADRATAHGYAYCIIGENIGEYRTPGLDTRQLADELLRGWQNSPEHRKNLLDADITDIGVGIARNDATGSYVGVQLFGLPKSASVAFSLANRTDTPVAYRLGGEAFTLPPSTVRTHQTCGAATLELQTGRPMVRRALRADEHLAVVRGPNGALQLQSDRRE